jgi:hypothetical protein
VIDWFPDWSGDDVAIIASGPSTKTAGIEQLRGKCRIIAIKENIDLCWKWCDLCYGCDASWWRNRNWLKDFPRLKVSFEAKHEGIHRIDIDRHVDRILTETPGRLGSGGNSGFQAVNLAVQFGARRIMLVGFDMTDRSGLHWYGRNRGQNRSNPTEDNFRRWRAAFHATAPWFRDNGIEVVNASEHSAVTCFPRTTVEKALQRWHLTVSISDGIQEKPPLSPSPVPA